MNNRSRVVLLGVVALAWFGLGAVNIARHQLLVGVVYVVCGVVVTLLALRMSGGRRSR